MTKGPGEGSDSETRPWPELEHLIEVHPNDGNGGGGGDRVSVGLAKTEGHHWGLLLRRLVLAALAGGLLVGCRWLAYQLRFDFDVPLASQVQLQSDWFWVIALQLVWLLIFGQFTGIYKYFSLHEIRYLAYAMAFAGLSLYAFRYLKIAASPPKGIILVHCLLGFLALAGMRGAWRMIHERWFSRVKHRCSSERKIAVIGAGDAGASLVRELYAHPNLGLVPVCFLDDDRRKWGLQIHGVPVLGAPESLERKAKMLELAEVVIAMPSAPAWRVREVVRLLHKTGLKHVIVPGVGQLTSGSVKISQLRPVKIEDLLGRERIESETGNIQLVLEGRVVLVTGAGGSIGSELCQQIAAYHPRQLLLVERSEPLLFQIEQELIALGHGKRIVPLVGDILDSERMEGIFAHFHPGVIFHAAAHKHVPMMESQPGEAIKNNSLGTAQLAELALAFGVDRFVLISTDKAINPTSAMGASKRLAEIYVQSLSASHPHQTKFMAVRFGNVLGSSGSVVPTFQKQIAAGGPVKVTHPEMRRYFMTIPEACMLVLQSAAQGRGGEIFVLDMGKPIRIVDLASQMIELSGFRPDEDIRIEFTGVRPGEKLFEELRQDGEDFVPTPHTKIFRFISQPPELGQLQKTLKSLRGQLNHASSDEIKRLLRLAVPEYTPALRLHKPPAPLPAELEPVQRQAVA